MHSPNSPVTNGKTEELRVVVIDQLIDGYRNFNVDIRSYIGSVETIKLFKCIDTGYRFYWPYRVTGDESFYNSLSRFDWYYMESKWEFLQVEKMINIEYSTLEVGCGEGAFIKMLNTSGKKCIGLEQSGYAVKNAHQEGIPLISQTIAEHADENPGKYDVVCSFQTLEHIPYVREFIMASLKALRVGGYFFISVPNNDSFLGKDESNFLNMPPHHMGLWDEKSLVSLERYFDMELVNIYYEPLQKYHMKYYFVITYRSILEKFFGIPGKYFGNILYLCLFPLLYIFKTRIKGFTILAVYRKI